MTFYARVHKLRKPARRIRPGTARRVSSALADRAGVAGKRIHIQSQLPHVLLDGQGNSLVLRSGCQRFLHAADVGNLGHGREKQHMRPGQAFFPAGLHAADGWRAGPGFAVAGALLPADIPYPLREEQISGRPERILLHRLPAEDILNGGGKRSIRHERISLSFPTWFYL